MCITIQMYQYPVNKRHMAPGGHILDAFNFSEQCRTCRSTFGRGSHLLNLDMPCWTLGEKLSSLLSCSPPRPAAPRRSHLMMTRSPDHTISRIHESFSRSHAPSSAASLFLSFCR